MGKFNELRKFSIPEIAYGVGSIKFAPNYINLFKGTNVFIVTDEGVKTAGWLQKITDMLEEKVIKYNIFSDVSPNPRDYEVMNGAELYHEKNCDIILALGGGSVIDCAKGIGVVVSNRKHILDFEGIDKIKIPMPPIICIPTTGGTSADVSQFAIINNIKDRYKSALISKALIPDVALVDPEMLLTMDPYLTACTGIDALVHAVEAFVSTGSSPITDLHAKEAINIIISFLHHSINEPANLEYRSKIMYASMQAGFAFSNASLGAVHAMAHSLGGYLDLPHGECNAILLERVVDMNYNSLPEKYTELAEVFGLKTKGMKQQEIRKKLVDFLTSFRKKAGIEQGLAAKGMHYNEAKILAKKALNDPCLITNPKELNLRDLEVIYEEAL